jgi:hypothetical protein
MNIARRVEWLERSSLNHQPAGDCGRGLKLERGTPSRWCALHGYSCWHRHSAREWAEAAVILEYVKRHEPMPDDLVILPALLAEARQLILSKGLESEEADDI